MTNYCCYSYYMSEFVTNVIKLIQDVKFFCYKFVRRITFFYSWRIYCVQIVCGMDGVLCFKKVVRHN